MEAFAAPILSGKEETWVAWAKELCGPKVEGAKDQNRRFKLTRHAAWLQKTPQGSMVIVLHEGPGASEFMGNLAHSDHDFDKWFKSKVTEIHGIDFTQAPPPKPELLIDLGQ